MSDSTNQYVCLSDLHLGAKYSILSARELENQRFFYRSRQQSQSLELLVDALRHYVPSVYGEDLPKLVLNGDCLDFDFGSLEDIVNAFTQVMSLLFDPSKPPLFQAEVIYLPGNHDHRIWEQMKDQLLVDNILKAGTGNSFGQNQISALYDNTGLASLLLNALLKKAGLDECCKINLHYPNLGLKGANNKRLYIHHGHYVEGIYRAMSQLNALLVEKEVIDLNELEAQNGGWIDFLWSSLGASESQMNTMVWLYTMSQDAAASHHSCKRLARYICDYLDKTYSVSASSTVAGGMSLEKLVVTLLDVSLGQIFQSERAAYHEALSDSAIEGLQWYLSKPLHKQICEAEEISADSELSFPCSFIFGHTHKPFQASLPVVGFRANVNVYNSGGWVLDEAESTDKQGAAIIFVDKDLNVASLRLFDAPVNARDADISGVRVEGLNSAEDESNDLLKSMQRALNDKENRQRLDAFSIEAKREAIKIVKYNHKKFFDPTRSPGIKREKSYDY